MSAAALARLRILGHSLQIKATLGTRPAAGYLRNNGVPLHVALLLLGRRL